MKNKYISVAIIIIGVLLIVLSAVLLISYHIKKANSDINAAYVIEKIEAALPERTAGVTEDRKDNSMPLLEIDGKDYIGILELSGRNIKLPVAADWNKAGIGYRPARLTGSIYDGTLIIGGNDNSDSFKFIAELDVGEKIAFIDMNGKVFAFTLDKITHSDNAKTETLEYSEKCLTLFVKKNTIFLIVRCAEK